MAVPDWISKVDLFLFINLGFRKDRRKEIETVLLQDLQVPAQKVRRIEAIRETPGFRGCTQSHLMALQAAIDANAECAAIFEDDYLPIVKPDEFHRRVSAALKHLDGKFDVVFLGMTPIDLQRTPVEGFYRVRAALAMPALIVHKRYFKRLKEIYQQALRDNKPHDLITQLYQPGDLWYGFFKPLGRQRPGFSDIENRRTDYAYLEVDGRMIRTPI